ncbi:hypothetical protein HPU229334_07820 [Helicobacter pullorum]|uniref:Uncharacterized protein n=2 Tax=Helicobacter pullorum TaxID=35818 RepID=A0A0N1EB17_9HELI|nr:hypothetical protein HPU229334_07820 [Helicobacter pullorum]OCR08939.1 hypothetical protein A7X13_06450 [Helicobacter pullorum]
MGTKMANMNEVKYKMGIFKKLCPKRIKRDDINLIELLRDEFGHIEYRAKSRDLKGTNLSP